MTVNVYYLSELLYVAPLPYLTFGVDVAHRQHPALRPPGGPTALPREAGMGSSGTGLDLEDTLRTKFCGLGLGLEDPWPWSWLWPQGDLATRR